MSLEIRVTLRCDGPACLHQITLRSSKAGVNATAARRTATDDYGWSLTAKKALCFDHRTKPIDFHPFGQRTDGEPWWTGCKTCGEFEGAVRHHEDHVMRGVSKMRRDPFQEWRY